MSTPNNPHFFAIVGLGGFGMNLATSLAQNGAEVVAIDREMSLVEEIKNDVTRAICLDATKKENLLAISADELDAVVVTIGEHDIESSILTTAVLAQIGVPLIISRATNDLHAEILAMVGAHEVINPEQDLALRLAARITQKGIQALIPLGEEGFAVSEVIAPEVFFGKSIRQIGIRANYNITIVAIKRTVQKFHEDGSETTEDLVQHNPGPNALIQANDILVCIGTFADIEQLAALH